MKHFHIQWAVDRMLRSESEWPWRDASVRAHLARCEDCRRYYDEGVLLLRAVRGASDAPGAGEIERMMRRAGQATLEPPGSSPRARWALAGVTAAVVLLGSWGLSGKGADVGVVVSSARVVVDGEEARPGARLSEGQDVVAAGGSAVIRLNGGRMVLIQEGSRMRFDAAGARASVESGAGYFRVEKGVGRFEVAAGTATVIVKGTEFFVERKDLTNTGVVVEEGLVEVRTKGGSAQVGAGQQTTVSGDSIATPTEIDLLERIRRGLQQFGKEIDRSMRK